MTSLSGMLDGNAKSNFEVSLRVSRKVESWARVVMAAGLPVICADAVAVTAVEARYSDLRLGVRFYGEAREDSCLFGVDAVT